MSKRIKYIFLGLLVVCFSSLVLNMCQAFSTKEMDWKEVVNEYLQKDKDGGRVKEVKEYVDSITTIIGQNQNKQ